MSITEIITWPFAWLLLTLYEAFANYGIAIILFSLIIKLIFLPFQMKSKRSTMRTSRLAPLMKELEKKHEGDKQKYQEAVSKLYKDEGVNPMSGCLWSLFPIIIMFIMYPIIRQPLTSFMRIGADALQQIKDIMTGMGAEIPGGAFAEIGIVDFIHNNFGAFRDVSSRLVDIDFSFLGMNLSVTPQWQIWTLDWSSSAIWLPALGLFFIPVISTLLSYLSMKVSNASNPAAAQQQGSMKSMMLMMPLMSLVIGFMYPAAMGIYWLTSSLFTMIQDVILNKYYGKILDAEDAERRERMQAQEEELERKRLETERLREIGATKQNKNTSKKKIQAAEKSKTEERLAQEKAERRAALGLTDDKPDSQVGTRRYARGRAYVMDRFSDPEGAEEKTANASAQSELDEQVEKEFETSVEEAVEVGEDGATEVVSGTEEAGEAGGE